MAADLSRKLAAGLTPAAAAAAAGKGKITAQCSAAIQKQRHGVGSGAGEAELAGGLGAEQGADLIKAMAEHLFREMVSWQRHSNTAKANMKNESQSGRMRPVERWSGGEWVGG